VNLAFGCHRVVFEWEGFVLESFWNDISLSLCVILEGLFEWEGFGLEFFWNDTSLSRHLCYRSAADEATSARL